MCRCLLFLFLIVANIARADFPSPGGRARSGGRGQEITPKLYGGTSSTSNLNLFQSTAVLAQANTGRIQIHERVTWPDNYIKTTTGQIFLLNYSGTVTGPGVTNLGFSGFNFQPTIQWDTAQSFAPLTAFYGRPVFAPTNAVTDVGSILAGFIAQVGYAPSVTSGAPLTPLLSGYYVDFINSISRAGTATPTITEMVGMNMRDTVFTASANITTGVTVGRLAGMRMGNAIGAGVVTEMAGVDLDALTKGNVNVSLRSVGSSVEMHHVGPIVLGATASAVTGAGTISTVATTNAVTGVGTAFLSFVIGDTFAATGLTGGPYTITTITTNTAMTISPVAATTVSGVAYTTTHRTATATAGAILDMGQNTAKTMILPKLTTATQTGLTAVSGMVLYNSDLDEVETRQSGAWESSYGTDRSHVYWAHQNSDATISVAGATGTGTFTQVCPSGTLGAGTASVNGVGYFGLYTTSAATGTSCGVSGSSVAWTNTQTRYAFFPVATFRIRTGLAADIDANGRIWCGLFSANPVTTDTPTGHLAAFRYSGSTVDSTGWQAVTRDGTTQTTTATGIAVAASTNYVLRIDMRNATQIKFSINNSLTNTITATLPGSGQDLSAHCEITTKNVTAHSFAWGLTHVRDQAF